ncbi:MAG: hypothetical protein J6X30_02585 [Clostridia bacterium]|nr:hypothetical protein [Clostridia bacterium]
MLLNKEEKRKRELCAFVTEEFTRRSRERLPYELQWQLNLQFFAGNQYCDIFPEAGKLRFLEKSFPWQEREAYNHIAPIVESRLAKLNKIVPRVAVRPATNDEEDVESARVSTAILRSAFERNAMSSLIREATVWSELCGTVFYKQDWVSRKGRVVGMNASGRSLYEGDIATTVCPPQEIYPDDPTLPDIAQCRSVIHAHIYPCAYVKELWGVDVKPQKIDAWGVPEALSGILRMNAAADTEERCLLLEYYEQPSTDHANGRYLAVCGDVLLAEEELPYRNGEGGTRKLPFVQQNAIGKPGCLWGTSVVERCIPLQRAYNAVRNRKHEFLNRAAIGVLTVEEGTADLEDLEENGLTPGRVLVYRQGASKPELLSPGSLPHEFAQEETSLREEFNLVSGTSDLMRRSVVPTNVSSGTALNTIAEQDDTRLAITADRIRDAILEISRQWLRLFKQFAGQTRLERVVGKNGRIARFAWNASMLTSDDCVHETENELSDSLSARKQLIYDLLARGLFSDDEGRLPGRTKGKILQALGMGDWESISDLSEIHTARAQRENQQLKNGSPVAVFSTDDHAIHVAEHSKELLSEEFEESFGLNSDARIRFEEHIKAHQSRMEAEEDGEGNGRAE